MIVRYKYPLTDTVAGTRRAAGLSLLATGHQPIDSGGIKSAQSTQNGRDRTRRSVRQDLSVVQSATHRQEKDPREEAHAEPGV